MVLLLRSLSLLSEGSRFNRLTVRLPSTLPTRSLLRLLKTEGVLFGWVEEGWSSRRGPTLLVFLNRKTGFRLLPPSSRVPLTAKEVFNRFSLNHSLLLSTSRGVLTARQAAALHLGGTPLAVLTLL